MVVSLLERAQGMLQDEIRRNTDAAGEYRGPPITALIEEADRFLTTNGIEPIGHDTRTSYSLESGEPEGSAIVKEISFHESENYELRNRKLAKAIEAFKATHGVGPRYKLNVEVKFIFRPADITDYP